MLTIDSDCLSEGTVITFSTAPNRVTSRSNNPTGFADNGLRIFQLDRGDAGP